MIPLEIELAGKRYADSREVRLNMLPPSASPALNPRLLPPSVEQFQEMFADLSRQYDAVLVILLSEQLHSTCANAIQAATALQSCTNIQVINSQTTSVGLGLLVQTAAEAVAGGSSPAHAERLVRSMIPHIYTIICPQGLSYLQYAGFMDHAQARIGEMLGLLPLFTLEEGQPTPLEKVRSLRQVLDFFQEFLSEFDHLRHIALLQGTLGFSSEARLLRQFAQDNHAKTPYSEHTINTPLATLLGPRSLCLIAAEER
jgi:DegV family protein with EDD domain